jgi:hypothetical protein
VGLFYLRLLAMRRRMVNRMVHGMVHGTMMVMNNPAVVRGMMNLGAGKTGQSDKKSNGH